MESSNVISEPAAEEINQYDQDDQQVQSSQSAQNQISQTRTYECNFCKRGFSNAQALGGHMNIHRKDKDKLAKAKKLKHHPLPNPPNYQQQFLLDVSSNTLSAPPADKLKSPNFEDQRPANIVLPNWDFHKEDDSGTATSRNQVSDAQNHSIFGGENDDNDDGFLEPELDLELRLGHEPTQSDSTPMGTRKFF